MMKKIMSIFFIKSSEAGVYSPTLAGFTLLVVIMLAILFVGSAIFGKNTKTGAKQLVYSSMAIALATITSFVKLFSMPMGGSVTLMSMLFVVLIGYWYGIGAGLTASVAYGILQLVTNPYILSVPQVIVDYVFAFGALGVSGLFSGKKNGLIKGYIAAVLLRFTFAVLSGIIFFPTLAPGIFKNSNIDILLYSVMYNGSYLAAESAVTVAVISLKPVKKALEQVKSSAKL